ncbi:MAG: hypothetical protein AAB599_03385 [Patescibacteria group bacterium]
MRKPARPDTDQIRSRLKVRHLAAKTSLRQKHPHAQNFLEEAGIDLGQIRQHSSKLLTAGAIGGALLLPTAVQIEEAKVEPLIKRHESSESAHYVPPATFEAETTNDLNLTLPSPVAKILIDSKTIQTTSSREYLQKALQTVLPQIIDRFSPPFLIREEEKVVEKLITNGTKIPTKATLEGEHLNTTYGYIGAEQHLKRYPGDTIDKHSTQTEGMAPGLGGFGYFTENGVLTSDAIEREKYYVVAQLMYLPDWKQRVKYLANWHKWRKMIVVNIENGNAVVGAMGDAGPAAWTGKHFGGSPEVMEALGGPKYKKGRVVMMFVDDPNNEIPLGPVKYNELPEKIVSAI